ncbi:cation/acetate symporter ActP [Paraburkholderia dipogonis]|uniref:Cation/acetate symporter ActP n=1 Tax=Paraburkholderia dipogonis TaxID=1211383 RepID=A0ABW9B6K2_9BURK
MKPTLHIPLLALCVPACVQAAEGNASAVHGATLNPIAISMFFLFVCVTLAITRWAARRNTSTRAFYTGAGNITGLQNGLAMAGDFMSAASFLGLSGMVFAFGLDGLIYAISFLVGWPFLMFLLAEPLRNLGKFTFVDVVAHRLQQVPIRLLTSCTSLVVVVFFLIVQMVGAGKLIELLFHLPYWIAEVIVGILMVTYVSFGGMTATTWVQIIKAGLLLFGVTFMALASLAQFGFSPEAMFTAAIHAHPHSEAIMGPGHLMHEPLNALSLGIAGMLGPAGFPHILMRFFTVRDAAEARKSVFFATGFIGYFYLLTFVIGFSAIALLSQHPEFFKIGSTGQFLLTRDLIGGTNMVAVNLAKAVGGSVFYGFIAAVTFATILAVVAGLTLAGAATVSHDLYSSCIARGKQSDRREMQISRISTVALTMVAVGLGIPFEHVNVAFIVSMGAAIAASANCPVLLCSIFWRGTTTLGAVLGGLLGLVSAVVLTILSKPVWVDVMQHATAPISLDNPSLFSVPLAFAGIFVFSKLDRTARAKREIAAFDAQEFISQTGISPMEATSH